MKTIRLLVLWFCLLPRAFAAEGETMAAFEERAKQAGTPEAAAAVVDEAFTSQDPERVAVCIREERTAAFVARRYADEPASVFKDQLTLTLIARIWGSDPETPGRTRPKRDPDAFRPYAEYMRERRGQTIVDPDSEEEMIEGGAGLKKLLEDAREFETGLIQAGHAKARMIPDAPAEATRLTRPRKDWTPEGDAETAEDEPFPVVIVAGSVVVLLAIGAYFAFRKKLA